MTPDEREALAQACDDGADCAVADSARYCEHCIHPSCLRGRRYNGDVANRLRAHTAALRAGRVTITEEATNEAHG